VQSIRNKGQPGVSLKLHRPFLTDLVALNLIGLSEGFDAQLLQTGEGPLDLSKSFMGVENDPLLGDDLACRSLLGSECT